eukprot:jgi/Botrbrau1/20000/Bobra.200_1s0008.1
MTARETAFTIVDEASLPGYPVHSESDARVFVSAVATLTLAILGSSTLPIPFAFSRLGLLLGIFTMALVAACNAVSSHVLLRAAGSFHHDSYEGVAEAAGGRTLKRVTQVSLGLLLFGTLVGDYAILADVGPQAMTRLLAPALPPQWLVGYSGRGVMILLVLFVVFPLCLLRRIRSLEFVGMSGIFVVLGLMAVFVSEAVKAGMPAVRSGEFPIWGVQWTSDLPEAFAVMGFAFYCQPMLMPLLHEMPRGQRGLKLMSSASTFTIMVVATVVYGVLGIFGAARFGLATEGNVLVNRWIGGRAEGVLDLFMVAYLAISAPIVQMSLRYTVDTLLVGEDAPYYWVRSVFETAAIVGSTLVVALFFPSYAEKIFAITGVIPVCLVSYILPVVIHLYILCRPGGSAERLGLSWLQRLFRAPTGYPHEAQGMPNGGDAHLPLLEAQLLDSKGESTACNSNVSRGFFWCEVVRELIVPIGVAVVGLGFSIGALWVCRPGALVCPALGTGETGTPLSLQGAPLWGPSYGRDLPKPYNFGLWSNLLYFAPRIVGQSVLRRCCSPSMRGGSGGTPIMRTRNGSFGAWRASLVDQARRLECGAPVLWTKHEGWSVGRQPCAPSVRGWSVACQSCAPSVRGRNVGRQSCASSVRGWNVARQSCAPRVRGWNVGRQSCAPRTKGWGVERLYFAPSTTWWNVAHTLEHERLGCGAPILRTKH